MRNQEDEVDSLIIQLIKISPIYSYFVEIIRKVKSSFRYKNDFVLIEALKLAIESTRRKIEKIEFESFRDSALMHYKLDTDAKSKDSLPIILIIIGVVIISMALFHPLGIAIAFGILTKLIFIGAGLLSIALGISVEASNQSDNSSVDNLISNTGEFCNSMPINIDAGNKGRKKSIENSPRHYPSLANPLDPS